MSENNHNNHGLACIESLAGRVIITRLTCITSSEEGDRVLAIISQSRGACTTDIESFGTDMSCSCSFSCCTSWYPAGNGKSHAWRMKPMSTRFLTSRRIPMNCKLRQHLLATWQRTGVCYRNVIGESWGWFCLTKWFGGLWQDPALCASYGDYPWRCQPI